MTSADQRSQVNLLWMRASHPVLTGFMQTCREALARDHRGLAFSQVYVTRESSRGMATVSYSGLSP